MSVCILDGGSARVLSILCTGLTFALAQVAGDRQGGGDQSETPGGQWAFIASVTPEFFNIFSESILSLHHPRGHICSLKPGPPLLEGELRESREDSSLRSAGLGTPLPGNCTTAEQCPPDSRDNPSFSGPPEATSLEGQLMLPGLKDQVGELQQGTVCLWITGSSHDLSGSMDESDPWKCIPLGHPGHPLEVAAGLHPGRHWHLDTRGQMNGFISRF